MLKRALLVLRSILKSNLNTPLSLNLFVCVFTYGILVVYCIICLHPAGGAVAAEGGTQSLTEQMQFYMDAVFPSTLTLVISMIVQNILENMKSRGASWFITLCPILFMVVYTMVCTSYRKIESQWQFVWLMLFSAVLVIGCFVVMALIQQNAKHSPPPNSGISA